MGGCADRHFKKYSSAEVKNNLFRDIFFENLQNFQTISFLNHPCKFTLYVEKFGFIQNEI